MFSFVFSKTFLGAGAGLSKRWPNPLPLMAGCQKSSGACGASAVQRRWVQSVQSGRVVGEASMNFGEVS